MTRRVKHCIAVSLLSAGLSIEANAQSFQAGLEAGFSYNRGFQGRNYGAGYGGEFIKALRPGIRAGIPVVLPVSPKIKLNTGLYYNMKGIQPFKKLNAGNVSYDMLELPMALTWYGGGDDQSFFIGLGPYIAYGLSNKEHRRDVSGNEVNYTLKWGTDLHRIDAGAHLQLGYRFHSGWGIRFVAERSLTNMGMKTGSGVLFGTRALTDLESRWYAALAVSCQIRFGNRY